MPSWCATTWSTGSSPPAASPARGPASKSRSSATEVAEPSSFVLFQDYHLYTAPGHLRKLRPEQVIFHFTHSSFCGPEGLDRLPAPIPRTVIEGLLGSDLLGFHVPPWVEGFLAGGGLLLVHDDALLELLDDWLADIAGDAFDDVLARFPDAQRTWLAFGGGRSVKVTLPSGPTTRKTCASAAAPKSAESR